MMANATSNQTTVSETVYICPNLPIEVETLPYVANTTAQVITLITCIVNGITCPVATVENLLVFAVVLKNRNLWTVFNTSVLCLAFTDLLIAMFIQPAFIAYQTGKYISCFACIPYFIKTVFEFWCVGLSFITLALITLERYYSVFKPFRYRASVTRFRLLCVILSGWIAWTVFSFSLRFSSNGMNLKAYSIVTSILISFTLIVTAFVCIKLYNATKIKDCSVSNQSDPNQRSDINSQEAKTTKTVVIVTAVFFLCFFPTLSASLVHQAGAAKDDVMLHLIYPLAESALFLTVVINPLIYVWRNMSVREGLKVSIRYKTEVTAM